MPVTALAVPAKEDRIAAAAVHIGSIFAPLLVPAIAFLVARGRRPFVAAHARQALVETVVLNVLIAIAIVVSLCFTVSRLWGYYQNGWQDIDWWGFAARLLFWWVADAVLWLINLVVSIRQAVGALNGVWPRAERKMLGRAR